MGKRFNRRYDRSMPFEIVFHPLSVKELERLRTFDQRKVLEAVELHLMYEPTKPTRNRKCLESLNPDFEHVPPVWEIRVGEVRVFYDVEEATRRVNIRAVRQKHKGKTTKEIT